MLIWHLSHVVACADSTAVEYDWLIKKCPIPWKTLKYWLVHDEIPITVGGNEVNSKQSHQWRDCWMRVFLWVLEWCFLGRPGLKMHRLYFDPPQFNIAPEKKILRLLILSFWEDLFSGANSLLYFRGVNVRPQDGQAMIEISPDLKPWKDSISQRRLRTEQATNLWTKIFRFQRKMNFQNDEHLKTKTREPNPTKALTTPKSHPKQKIQQNLPIPTCICCNLHQKKTLNRFFFQPRFLTSRIFGWFFIRTPHPLKQNTPPERLRLRRPPPQGKAKPSHQPQENHLRHEKTSYFPLYQLVNDWNLIFPNANKLNKGFAAEESDVFFEIFGWHLI